MAPVQAAREHLLPCNMIPASLHPIISCSCSLPPLPYTIKDCSMLAILVRSFNTAPASFSCTSVTRHRHPPPTPSTDTRSSGTCSTRSPVPALSLLPLHHTYTAVYMEDWLVLTILVHSFNNAPASFLRTSVATPSTDTDILQALLAGTRNQSPAPVLSLLPYIIHHLLLVLPRWKIAPYWQYWCAVSVPLRPLFAHLHRPTPTLTPPTPTPTPYTNTDTLHPSLPSSMSSKGPTEETQN